MKSSALTRQAGVFVDACRATETPTTGAEVEQLAEAFAEVVEAIRETATHCDGLGDHLHVCPLCGQITLSPKPPRWRFGWWARRLPRATWRWLRFRIRGFA